MCLQQEVKCRRQAARFVGVNDRRNKPLWSENNDKIIGVDISVKEGLCEVA